MPAGLPARAVWVLVLVTMVAIAVAVSTLLWSLRVRELNRAGQDTAGLARMLLEQTVQSIDAVDMLLRGTQDRLQSSFGKRLELDSGAVRLLLASRTAAMHQVRGLFVVDAQGRIVNGAPQDPDALADRMVADQDYFRVLAGERRERLFIGRPVQDPHDHSLTLHLARRLAGPDGSFRGVAVAALDLSYFETLYGSLTLEFVRPVSLYFDDGTVLANWPRSQTALGEHAAEFPDAALRADVVQLHTHVSGNGARAVRAFARSARFPLVVGVTSDEIGALAVWRETAAPIVLGAAFMCLLIVVIGVFVTDRLRRQEELQRVRGEAEERFRGTVESVMDAIVATDEQQRILLFNPAAERMFGLRAVEVLGQPLDRLLPERFRDGHGRHIERFVRSGQRSMAMSNAAQASGRRRDGTEFPIESTISQTIVGAQRQLTVVLRDVTARRQAEAELHAMNRQLRDLSTALEGVREQERARISRELHDDLGQQLTGLKLDLAWLLGKLADGRTPAPDKVQGMRRHMDEAIAAVRRIATELRPAILDDLGFAEAVSAHGEDFKRRTGIGVRLELEAADRVGDGERATALFRIVQEALTNVARHSGAGEVHIRLVAEDGGLALTVSDDGRGFGGRAEGAAGIGLISMRERASALGGAFEIRSHPGAGTVVAVRLPLDRAQVQGGAA